MTTDRNVDRIVTAWLDLMPSEAPDRVVTAVLEAVATEPQVRAFAPALRRSPLMTRLLIAATAAALVIAGIGGALLIGGGGTPAPSQEPSPSASEAAGVPSAFVQRWIGAPRDIPGLGTSLEAELDFNATSVALSYAGRKFISDPRIVGDTLEVTTPPGSTSGRGTCAAGDVGTYSVELAPAGSRLALEAIDDACEARSTAFSGTWYRVACKADNTCFGDLDAGSYPTVNFGPLLDPAVPSTRDFGELTYTVPDGWSIASDHTSDIRLVRSNDYALETADGPPNGEADGIEAWIRPAALTFDDPCNGQPAPDVGRTPDALVEWFASHPALDADDPQDITIDGHDGRMIDFEIAPSHSTTCGFPGPVVALLGEDVGAGGSVGDEPYVAGILAPARHRWIFLDLGNDRVVAILVRAVDPDRFDEFLAEAMPIVESFDFR
jgi:hypothetical protein